tara:strand:- start:785 stop:1066 length:282 start_codon:yes stop_codon:yes gene_type:complete
MKVSEEKQRQKLDTNYSKDYINYIIRELEELRWEHSWMKSYEKDNKLETIGIPKDENYNGVAQYCRCYMCRPNMYEHLKQINEQIKNILNNCI